MVKCKHGMPTDWCALCTPPQKVPSQRVAPFCGKYLEKVPSKNGKWNYRYKDTRWNRKNVKIYGRVRQPWSAKPSGKPCVRCGGEPGVVHSAYASGNLCSSKCGWSGRPKRK